MADRDRDRTGTRDLITRVVLSSGETVDVCMPTLGECEALLRGEVDSDDTMLFILSASTGKTIEYIRGLPLPDGLKLMNTINPAMEAMNEYILGAVNALDNTDPNANNG